MQYISELKERNRTQKSQMEETLKANDEQVKRLKLQIEHLNTQIQKSVETNQAVDMEQVQNFDLDQSILSQAPPGEDALGNDL